MIYDLWIKTQFGGMTVSTDYRRSIFQVEWFIATLIIFEVILSASDVDRRFDVFFLFFS